MRALYLIAFASFATVAAAQQNASPSGSQPAVAAACLLPPAKMDAAEVQHYSSDPSLLFKDAPEGDDRRAASVGRQIRRLVGSDTKTLAPLGAYAKTLPSNDKRIVGRALMEVARLCTTISPEAALAIQTFVAELGDAEITEAFLRGGKELDTAALAFSASRGPGAASIAAGSVGPATMWTEGTFRSTTGPNAGVNSSGFGGGGLTIRTRRNGSPSEAQP
ncbi:hypothetical protein [Prosthecomicrobium sp. N25]|uniref:hypothetical protein n=1 Tax=Prosthecomicrobium sp. N25 TaxID=3129254 RepID=UPI003077DAA3